jgi:hypothetical protein
MPLEAFRCRAIGFLFTIPSATSESRPAYRATPCNSIPSMVKRFGVGDIRLCDPATATTDHRSSSNLGVSAWE